MVSILIAAYKMQAANLLACKKWVDKGSMGQESRYFSESKGEIYGKAESDQRGDCFNKL